jgi:PAS domain S-box-containing protein/putative nucleotidyltransferase with HDIG domain
MEQVIRILHLEDDPADAGLVKARLKSAGLACQITRIETRSEFLEAIQKGESDVILADYNLPGFNGIAALELAQGLNIDTPFIFVSGVMGEDAAIEGLTKGATDYVLKDKLTRLAPAVNRALREAENRRERRRAEEALRESEISFRAVFEKSVDALGVITDGIVGMVNPAFVALFGYMDLSELQGKPVLDLITLDQRNRIKKYMLRQLIGDPTPTVYETRGIRKDGTEFDMDVHTSIYDLHGASHILIVLRDITERKQAEAALDRQVLFDELMTWILTRFATCTGAEIDANIELALQSIAEFIGVDHAYVLTFSVNQGVAWEATYEWCGPNVSPQLHEHDTPEKHKHGEQPDFRIDEWNKKAQLQGDEIIRINEPDSSPDVADPGQFREGALSILAVPIWGSVGQIKGSVGLHSHDHPVFWSDNDVARLKMVGDAIAGLLERKRAEEQILQNAARAEALARTAARLNAQLNLDTVLNTVCEETARALNVPIVHIFLYDPQRDVLSLAQMIGLPPRYLTGYIPTARVRYEEFARENGNLFVLPDIQALTDSPNRDAYVEFGIRTFTAAGMMRNEQLVGVLAVLTTDTVRVFSEDELALLKGLADQAAQALVNSRLLEETRQRLAELEAINKVSTALRVAETLTEMLPQLMDVTLAALHASLGSIWLYDQAKDELRPEVMRGWYEVTHVAGHPPLKPGDGIEGSVFLSGQAMIVEDFHENSLIPEGARQQLPPGIGGASVPIRAGENVIGTLSVSVLSPRKLAPGEINLLSTLSEIAGNAIHRVQLHQQTSRRLQYLTALSDIDHAISSSFDLNFSLTTLLMHVTLQLKVDAADVLLLKSGSQTLEYSTGRGFRTNAVERAQLRLGESYPGRAALERRIVHIHDLTEQRDELLLTRLLAGEDFISYYAVPLVAKGQVKGVLEIFHRSILQTDDEWVDFLRALAGQAAIAIENATLFDSLQRTNIELTLAYDATIEGWSRALDLRDKETEGHTQRVTEMTVKLARAYGKNEQELVYVRWGALLHDIGKMGVPDGILLKPGPLTPEEWGVMRKHPTLAYEMLSPIRHLKPALDIPYYHHERWDGSGYPHGLKGEQIPFIARLFAVVDSWDALTSDRPYHPAVSAEEATREIQAESGTHLDPDAVQAFFNLFGFK